jgi:hypothetical protein
MEHKLSGLGSMGTEETIGMKRCLHDEYPLERVLLGSITSFLNGFCYGVFFFFLTKRMGVPSLFYNYIL